MEPSILGSFRMNSVKRDSLQRDSASAKPLHEGFQKRQALCYMHVNLFLIALPLNFEKIIHSQVTVCLTSVF